MTTVERYSTPAIVLHWLVALLIFATFPLGLYMADLALSPIKLRLFSYHKWIGITVLMLALLRAVWRVTHAPPPLPEGMPDWQRRTSQIVHGLLYLLIFAIPLSGWLMSSAEGFPVVWFGVLPLPDLIGKDKALGELLVEVHETLNYTMLALVSLHVAAVIKHQFLEHQSFLQRMGWSRRTHG